MEEYFRLRSYVVDSKILLNYEKEQEKSLSEKVFPIFPYFRCRSLHIYNPQFLFKNKFIKILKAISHSKLEIFVIDGSGNSLPLKITSFVPDMTRVLPKCLIEISFKNFRFSKRDLQHVIYNSTSCRRLRIVNCKLDFEDITFNCKGKSKMTELDFTYTGRKKNSNWEENLYRFENLVKAISESSIRVSLKKIVTIGC